MLRLCWAGCRWQQQRPVNCNWWRLGQIIYQTSSHHPPQFIATEAVACAARHASQGDGYWEHAWKSARYLVPLWTPANDMVRLIRLVRPSNNWDIIIIITVMVDIKCKVFTGSIEICNNLIWCDGRKNNFSEISASVTFPLYSVLGNFAGLFLARSCLI